MDHLSKHDLTARYHIIQRSKSKDIICFMVSVVNYYEEPRNRKEVAFLTLIYAFYDVFTPLLCKRFHKSYLYRTIMNKKRKVRP